MSHFSSYDEDEAKESEREGKRRKMEFDCPSCNANNPTPEPIADGSELLCNYCGQRGFWARWRHRDPVKFANEIGRLHREHGVMLFNLADENPTVNRDAWIQLCEALIAEKLDPGVKIIGSTRADDIVRDAAVLHLTGRPASSGSCSASRTRRRRPFKRSAKAAPPRPTAKRFA